MNMQGITLSPVRLMSACKFHWSALRVTAPATSGQSPRRPSVPRTPKEPEIVTPQLGKAGSERLIKQDGYNSPTGIYVSTFTISFS